LPAAGERDQDVLKSYAEVHFWNVGEVAVDLCRTLLPFKDSVERDETSGGVSERTNHQMVIHTRDSHPPKKVRGDHHTVLDPYRPEVGHILESLLLFKKVARLPWRRPQNHDNRRDPFFGQGRAL